MTIKQRHICVSEMQNYPDKASWLSDMALSTLWIDGNENDISQNRIDELSALWDAWHSSIADIASSAGLSYRKLAERFGIPYRTMEDWSAGKRTPPAYVLNMMVELLSGDSG